MRNADPLHFPRIKVVHYLNTPFRAWRAVGVGVDYDVVAVYDCCSKGQIGNAQFLSHLVVPHEFLFSGNVLQKMLYLVEVELLKAEESYRLKLAGRIIMNVQSPVLDHERL